MNKRWLVMLLLGQSALADNYVVPDIASAPAPIPLFGDDVPLSERDHKALSISNQWLQGERYPHREGDRITFLYGSGQPTLVCAPLELCVIYLEAGEQVVENGVHLGDSVRWQVAPAIGADQRTQLVVKPIDVGLETSLVIITDRRTYHIKLRSRSKDYMPGLAFKYPANLASDWHDYHQKNKQKQNHQSMLTGVSLSDLDFNYSIHACFDCDFSPVRVYNDGKQTVIEMPKSFTRDGAPALLGLDGKNEELMNYRLIGNKYIVDRIFKEAILIQGVGKQQRKVSIRWGGKK